MCVSTYDFRRGVFTIHIDIMCVYLHMYVAGINVHTFIFRPLDNLRFADDIDLLADTKESVQDLRNRVDDSSKRMGLEINAEKTKRWQ